MPALIAHSRRIHSKLSWARARALGLVKSWSKLFNWLIVCAFRLNEILCPVDSQQGFRSSCPAAACYTLIAADEITASHLMHAPLNILSFYLFSIGISLKFNYPCSAACPCQAVANYHRVGRCQKQKRKQKDAKRIAAYLFVLFTSNRLCRMLYKA